MAKFAATSVLITLAMAASACGTSDVATEDGSPTTQAPTTAPEETTSTTVLATTTETTAATVPTTVASAGEFEAFDIPPGFFFESSVYGDRLVVFGRNGSGPGGVFWAVDQPIESAVNIQDLAPAELDPGSIYQMVYFESRYYAFPTWAEPEDDQRPTMYVV